MNFPNLYLLDDDRQNFHKFYQARNGNTKPRIKQSFLLFHWEYYTSFTKERKKKFRSHTWKESLNNIPRMIKIQRKCSKKRFDQHPNRNPTSKN